MALVTLHSSRLFSARRFPVERRDATNPPDGAFLLIMGRGLRVQKFAEDNSLTREFDDNGCSIA